MSKHYLFANWKMYLDLKESVQLAEDFVKIKYPKDSEVAVFPTALAFEEVVKVLDGKAASGAQNIYWAEKGGYTGEVSAEMYKALGAKYVLIGHAERRHIFHETNSDVRQKIEAVLELGMTPVLCVGETGKERDESQTETVLETQLRAAFMDLSFKKDLDIIIAYEPVWAIGTGKSCEPAEAMRVAKLIKNWTKGLLGREPVVLYGGSVRSNNVKQYVVNDFSGILVGGASAKIDSWRELIEELK